MSEISATDLILSSEGAVYHLGLLPNQIAKTIITVGDPDRVAAISRHFDIIDHKVAQREFHTHTGWYKGKHLTVISTGIGTDNIDIVLNELDALVNIDLATRTRKDTHTQLTFIRVGTSGAILPDWAPGKITFSRYAVGFDNLMHFYDYDPSGKLGLLGAEVADILDNQSELMVLPYLTEVHAELLVDRLPKHWQQGVSITAPGFYAPQGRFLRAKPAEKKLMHLFTKIKIDRLPVSNIEMETSGLYGLSYMLGHRAISISVILANRSTDTFHDTPAEAVENLIQEVLAWLIA